MFANTLIYKCKYNDNQQVTKIKIQNRINNLQNNTSVLN